MTQPKQLDLSTSNDELGIVPGDDSYPYYLIDADGHRLPVYPEDVSALKSLLDEFVETVEEK